MKKNLFTLIFFLTYFNVTSQNSDQWQNLHQFKFGYGILNLTQEFYKNPLENISESRFKNSIEVVSLTASVRHDIKINRSVEVGYLYYIPEQIALNDSIKAKRKGYNVSLIIKRDLFSKQKRFDLFVGGGICFGRQRIYIYDNAISDYRNYNASLLPQIDLEFQPFNRLAFGIDANFLFDLTFQKWKSKHPVYPLAPSKLAGTLLRFSISFFM